MIAFGKFSALWRTWKVLTWRTTDMSAWCRTSRPASGRTLPSQGVQPTETCYSVWQWPRKQDVTLTLLVWATRPLPLDLRPIFLRAADDFRLTFTQKWYPLRRLKKYIHQGHFRCRQPSRLIRQFVLELTASVGNRVLWICKFLNKYMTVFKCILSNKEICSQLLFCLNNVKKQYR